MSESEHLDVLLPQGVRIAPFGPVATLADRAPEPPEDDDDIQVACWHCWRPLEGDPCPYCGTAQGDRSAVTVSLALPERMPQTHGALVLELARLRGVMEAAIHDIEAALGTGHAGVGDCLALRTLRRGLEG